MLSNCNYLKLNNKKISPTRNKQKKVNKIKWLAQTVFLLDS
jgi:hypothetical protein